MSIEAVKMEYKKKKKDDWKFNPSKYAPPSGNYYGIPSAEQGQPIFQMAPSRNSIRIAGTLPEVPPGIDLPSAMQLSMPSLESKDLKYRLKIDGDPLEKVAWDSFVQNLFPNYELVWLQFVVPRTYRPNSIHTKEDTPEEERILIMLHYAILQNLYWASIDIENAYNRKVFEQIYVRLSSTADVCEEFIFRFLLWIEKKSMMNVLDDLEWDEKTASITFEKRDAEKNLKKGKNYVLSIISKKDIIQRLDQKKEINTDLYTQFNAVRHYRNTLVHSWPLFQIGLMCITEKALHKDDQAEESKKVLRDWVKIQKILDDESKRDAFIKNNYADMWQMASKDFVSLVRMINETWCFILNKLSTMI